MRMLSKSVSRTLSQTRLTNIRPIRQKRMSTSASRSQNVPATVHSVATCGIPRWEPPKAAVEDARKVKIELPSHLIRPPCMPGGVQGEIQTCVTESEEQGLYCQPCRKQYKYPSFSENIDFVPPQDTTSCWWQMGLSCNESLDDGALTGITKPCTMEGYQ